jgi:hypothetical protein
MPDITSIVKNVYRFGVAGSRRLIAMVGEI